MRAMAGRRNVQRWALAAAGGCAVFGLLVKFADLDAANESQPAPAPRDQARAVREQPRLAMRTNPDAREEAWTGAEPHAPGEPGQETPTGAPARGAGLPSVTDIPDLVGRSFRGEHPHERKRPSRHEKRARKGEHGLQASRVGELEAGVPEEPSQHAGQGPGSAPRTSPGAEPPPPPPTRGDVAFQSEDTTQYPTGTQVEIPDLEKLAGHAGTVSFWLQPQWGEGNQDDAAFIDVAGGRLQVIKNVNFVRFEFTDDQGLKGGVGAPITEWKAGEWHQVTATWSSNQRTLYLDGQLVSQGNGGAVSLQTDTKLAIGSDFPMSRPVAPGVIGGVDVYGRPLGPSEVAHQYTQAIGTNPLAQAGGTNPIR
jgi:hypothetical protein